ncbi:MAG: hotdog fold thioesterase [Novosphingobium sp.]|nr:hotdog fold thioesterase [Novosphingobium sp.]
MIWFGGERPSLERFRQYGKGTLQGLLGMEAVDCGDDWLRVRMPVDQRTHQPFGRLHGGASVALAETAASMAATHCVDPDQSLVVGLEINANHVRPAYDGWVYATARPETLGRTIHVWSIRIEDEAGKLICISRFTAAVIAKERR